MALELNYEPKILVKDTHLLPSEEWLEWRRKGVGGSDVAAIIGVSSWTTNLDLYYDKTGIRTAYQEGDGKTGIPLIVGTAMEAVIAELYANQTGNEVQEDHNMYFHPLFPHMLANVDRRIVVKDKTGRKGILECKYAMDHKKKLWAGTKVPVDYEWQGRNYLSVLNADFVDYAVLFSDYTFWVRHMERDLFVEEHVLIPEIDWFWNEHVKKLIEPKINGTPDLAAESLRRHLGAINPSRPEILLSPANLGLLRKYMELKKQDDELSEQKKQLGEQMKALKIPLMKELENSPGGRIVDGAKEYFVTQKNSPRRQVTDWDRFQNDYPDVYAAVASEKLSFTMKIQEKERS